MPTISSTIRPYHLTQKPPKISKNYPFHPLDQPNPSHSAPPKPPKYSKNHPFHSTQKPFYKNPPNIPKPNFVHTKPHGQPNHFPHLGINQFQRNQKSVQGIKINLNYINSSLSEFLINCMYFLKLFNIF